VRENCYSSLRWGLRCYVRTCASVTILTTLRFRLIFFLPLHTSVLEPDLYLPLSEAQSVGNLDSPPSGQVAVEVEFLLQLQRLVPSVRLTPSLPLFWLWTLEKFPEEKSEVCTLLLKWSSGTAGVPGDLLAVVIRIITCEDLRLLPYAEDQLLQISVEIYFFRGCWYHFKYIGQFRELCTAIGTKISYYNIFL